MGSEARTINGRGRDLIAEMIAKGVLKELKGNIRVPDGGAILIADSETDPTAILRPDRVYSTIRTFLFEVGVLVLTPDRKLSDQIGIDPNSLIVKPLLRCVDEGTSTVLLCVNPNSIGGLLQRCRIVELVNHLVRAGLWLSIKIPTLDVHYVVHVPHTDGSCTNYELELSKWSGFHAWYNRKTSRRRREEAAMNT